MIVAIHQPNYLPWLGYFSKIAHADVFVFLDDVQYSKGSFTNRVMVGDGERAAWLTIPVRHRFGEKISDVVPANGDFPARHWSRLEQLYKSAAAFPEVRTVIERPLIESAGSLAQINAALVRAIASVLGLTTKFVSASTLGIQETKADERLAAIVSALAPSGVYLSGLGASKYQTDEAFQRRGITLKYTTFRPQTYDRSGLQFIPGLSIVDALFHCGVDETIRMIRQ